MLHFNFPREKNKQTISRSLRKNKNSKKKTRQVRSGCRGRHSNKKKKTFSAGERKRRGGAQDGRRGEPYSL